MTIGDRQAAFAATLVDEWVRAGLAHAVICPGSRSTPLALALAAHGRMRVHVHLDERSAAFFAVGLGLATGRPAVVVTTSGTAAVELHPAVVEADLAAVPLLVCTADRPAELHRVGAPQTVEQGGLYGGAVRWAFEPGVADGLDPASWRSIAARAVAEATTGPAGPGPVHLNLAFRDPLVAEPGDLPPGRPDGRPWHEARRPAGAGAGDVAGELSGRRGVIVAGRRAGRHGLRHLAAALGWPVWADPRSQARGWPQSVAAFDAILRTEAGREAAAAADVVLRVGEPPASKVLSQWLAGAEADQVVVDPYGRWTDPERRATLVVHADPTRLALDVADVVVAAPAGWLDRWQRLETGAQAAIDAHLAARNHITEPGVARALTASLDLEVALVVSSSMPIRDVEWYGHPKSAHRVHANRGANGIDGVVSTALGVAAAGSPVVALVGDLAFLHDVGALWGARQRACSCVVVVVDNDGGGIFSFLPQRAELAPHRFEALFGTPHGLDLAAVSAAYGVPARQPGTVPDLVGAVTDALAAGGVQMVHVRTDRDANVAVHDEIHAAVAAALA